MNADLQHAQEVMERQAEMLYRWRSENRRLLASLKWWRLLALALLCDLVLLIALIAVRTGGAM